MITFTTRFPNLESFKIARNHVIDHLIESGALSGHDPLLCEKIVATEQLSEKVVLWISMMDFCISIRIGDSLGPGKNLEFDSTIENIVEIGSTFIACCGDIMLLKL